MLYVREKLQLILSVYMYISIYESYFIASFIASPVPSADSSGRIVMHRESGQLFPTA